jgi:hypothetical protein
MQTIVAPIDRQQPVANRAQVIGNLQDALLFLLRQHMLNVPDASFEQGLLHEQSQQVFSDVTEKTVAIFQGQYRDRFPLQVNGKVDAPTADALNQLLKQLGAFGAPAPAAPAVRGQIFDDRERPVLGVEVNVYDRGLGDARQRLGKSDSRYVTDQNGRFEVDYAQSASFDGEIGGPDLVFAVGTPGHELPIRQINRLPVDGDASVATVEAVTGD